MMTLKMSKAKKACKFYELPESETFTVDLNRDDAYLKIPMVNTSDITLNGCCIHSYNCVHLNTGKLALLSFDTPCNKVTCEFTIEI